MADLGFPNNPNLNDEHTIGNKTWVWDGESWKIKSTGFVGPQGVQGPVGLGGVQGFQGFKGDQGNQGLKGDQGNQGLKGDQGNQGLKGDQGNQGLKGDQGNQGNQGNQGLKGDQGNQGLKGDQGNQGNQGNQGSQGLKGDQGNQGLKGDQGNQGNQGLKGDQGNQGLKGDQGNQGNQGLKGDQGNQGNQGNQGLKGDQGNQGNQGIQGIAGSISSITTEAAGGSAVFVEGSNYYYNKFLTTKTDKTPLLTKYAEKFYDHGSPTSTTAFDINLENGNIHLINFVSAATGTTKYFTFSGYVTASDVSNLSLVIRGGLDLTIDWGSNVYFSEETGNPVLGITGDGISGSWSFIPFVYIPSSDSFFGGSQLTFIL